MTDAATQSPATGFSLKPLLFAACSGSMAMMAFVAVIGPIARLLSLEPWHVGMAVTAAGVAWMVMARFWGARSDRLGRRRILLVGLAGFAISYLALSLFMAAAVRWVPAAIVSFLGMTLARVSAGAFYAAVPPVCAAIVADHTPPHERARAMGAIGAASAIGMVVGPSAAGLLAAWSLSASLMIIAALPILALLVAWRMLPADSRHENRKPAALKMSDARIRRPLVLAFAAMAGVVMAQVVVGFLVLDRFGLSPSAAARVSGIALALVGASLFVSQMVLRRMNWTPMRFIKTGGVIAAAGFVAAVFADGPMMLWTAYMVIAAGMGWVYPSISALAANSVEAHEQGSAAGSVAAAQGLATVIAPLLGTAAYTFSTGSPYLLSAAMMLIPIIWSSAK